jgi:CRP-like cAMP-binding protein
MDPHSLEGLVRQSRLLHLRGGEVVFKQDDPPDCLYVVVNGSVAMFDEAANVELYRVGENEFFGEGALIGNDPQSTTARVSEDCDLLAFGRDSMRDCIVDNLNVVPVLLRFLRSRMLEQLVRTSPLFAHLDTAERRALSRQFEFIEVSDGALLIRQGGRSPGLFVLLSGAVDVIRRDGEREHWLATRVGKKIAGGPAAATGLLVCRFSDAGMPRPSSRSESRRPKSAKAGNRGMWGTDGAAGAMGI